MVCRNLLRSAAALVLAAILLPLPATAAPERAARPVAESRNLLASAWGFLLDLFLGEATDTGCGIDPDGRQLCGPAPGSQSDTGCAIDPNGRPLCGPAQ